MHPRSHFLNPTKLVFTEVLTLVTRIGFYVKARVDARYRGHSQDEKMHDPVLISPSTLRSQKDQRVKC